MMISLILLLTMTVGWAVNAATPNQVRMQLGEQDGVNAVLTIDEPHLVRNQPVVVTLEISNSGLNAVTINLGPNRVGALRFSLTGSSGRKIILEPIRQDGFAGGGSIVIPGHAKYTQRIVLNEWHRFTDPGTYSVSLIAPIGASTRNAPLTFEISGEDPALLRDLSEKLLSSLKHSRSFEDASVTATALCWVTDPIASPYQEAALSSTSMVDGVMIRTLRNIGGPQSAEVLINAMRAKPTADWILSAKSALETIGATTKDIRLRKRIRFVLGSM
jgi:hypothetical protein